MAITHAWSSVVATTNGNNITITIPASSVATGDVVVAFGGKPGRNQGALGPVDALGYTSIYQTSTATTGPNFWVGFKIMGVTPDSSFVGRGSGNASDGTAYGAYIFRGVSSVVHDAPFTRSNGNSTNPDAPSIITATDNAVAFIPAISQIQDTAVFSVLGYSNFKFGAANDTLDVTVAGNWASIASAGTTNPGAYQGWGSASWVALTLALQPEAPLASGDTFQSYIGTVGITPPIFRGLRY